MAEINAIRKLDLKLLENRIIDPEFRLDCKLVHNMLNSHVRKNGKILTEDNFKKGDDKLRSWLMSLYKKGASQEKLTSYLRCGLAHLCYDFIESNYKKIPEEDLLSRALSSFKLRKYHTNFFKVSRSELKPKKKKIIKKKKIAKKVIKKTPVKKNKSSNKNLKKVTSLGKRVISNAKKAVKKSLLKKRSSTKKRTVKKTSKPSSGVKRVIKKIIKKTVPKKIKNSKKNASRRVIKINIKSRTKSYKSKSTKKPRSISSKLQSFLKKKKIISKKPSSYWKDK